MVAPVINMPSNKHSGVSGRDTQLFVQHSAESPLRGGYAQSLTNWARTPLNQGGPEASWPSFVDPIARVRMVAWPNSAWTQGLANQIGVGLECAGYARFSESEWLTPEGLKQLENLAHEWCYYLDLEAKAGNIIPLRWLSTTEVQKVMAGNRSIKGFCTHAQIDPGSRTDPGKGFPYTRLMNRIKELRGETVTPAAASKPAPTQDWFDTLDEKTLRRIIHEETVAYKGAQDRDVFSFVVNSSDEAAHKTVREHIKVTDTNGKIVDAQLAAFIGTIWKQVHRNAPKQFKEIVARLGSIEAMLAEVADGGDLAAVTEASKAGALAALQEWERDNVQEIAIAVVDEQAERLAPKQEAK